MANDLEIHTHRTNLMNEPRHIRDVVIRSLDAQIRAVTIRIEELKQEKASWEVIEGLMDTRDELVKALANLRSDK